MTSASSNHTVHHSPVRKTSMSAFSQGRISSGRLHVRNENVPLRSSSTTSSRPSTPTPHSASRRRLRRGGFLYRSSWENDSPPTQRLHNAPSPLSDPGHLEDVDLGSRCHSSSFQSTEERGLSFDVKDEEALPIPRQLSDASQDAATAKPFSVKTDHPFKHDRPFRKWVGSLHRHPHKQAKSLTVREKRWDLDEFADRKPATRAISKRHRLSSHGKSSSWSSSGLVNTIKAAATPHTPRTNTRKKGLKSNRGPRASDAAHCGSRDDCLSPLRVNDQAAFERASQRRQVLNELLSSELSYVADLKVLLHVRSLTQTI